VGESDWTFLTNHTHVMVCLAQDSDATVRQMAGQVGITERAVQRILRDLEVGGAIRRRRIGRRNAYELNREVRLRHPLERECSLGELLDAVMLRSRP